MCAGKVTCVRHYVLGRRSDATTAHVQYTADLLALLSLIRRNSVFAEQTTAKMHNSSLNITNSACKLCFVFRKYLNLCNKVSVLSNCLYFFVCR